MTKATHLRTTEDLDPLLSILLDSEVDCIELAVLLPDTRQHPLCDSVDGRRELEAARHFSHQPQIAASGGLIDLRPQLRI